MRSRRALIPILLATLCLPALPAAATSYVPMTDEALVDQAPVVVVAVMGSAGSASQDGRPSTEYAAHVERVLKGTVSSREIMVSVPGGVRADGIGLRIWGAPRFAKGERALLFLRPQAGGIYQISQLMLGAFHEVRSGGRRLAVRDLSEAQPVVPRGWKAPAETTRDFDRFASWVEAHAHGRPVPTHYQVQADPRLPRSMTDPFSLFSSGGLNMRWFDFDLGNSVSFLAHQDGQPGVPTAASPSFRPPSPPGTPTRQRTSPLRMPAPPTTRRGSTRPMPSIRSSSSDRSPRSPATRAGSSPWAAPGSISRSRGPTTAALTSRSSPPTSRPTPGSPVSSKAAQTRAKQRKSSSGTSSVTRSGWVIRAAAAPPAPGSCTTPS